VARKEVAEELHTGKVSRRWKSDLPSFVEHMNAGAAKLSEAAAAARPSFEEDVVPVAPEGQVARLQSGNRLDLSSKVTDILEEGTHVRVVHNEPHDIFGKKQARGQTQSGFRRGDPRWSATVHTIVGVRLMPGRAPRYFVSGIPQTSFAVEQIQVVDVGKTTKPPKPRPNK